MPRTEGTMARSLKDRKRSFVKVVADFLGWMIGSCRGTILEVGSCRKGVDCSKNVLALGHHGLRVISR